MSKILTAQSILDRFTSRNHIKPSTDTVDISASAEEPVSVHLTTVQAMAVKGFAQISGPLQYVKAKEHFFVAGEPVFVDDFVQVTAEDAKRLEAAGRAELVTDAQAAAAQKASK